MKLLEDRGITPRVVDYLTEPLSVLELEKLSRALGLGPWEMIRKKEKLFGKLELSKKANDPTALFAAMATHPILLERPIVSCGGKARIGRPPQKVLEVLD